MRGMTRTAAGVISLLLGAPSFIRAQQENPPTDLLTLTEAARAALAHFPSVGASRAQTEAAQAAIDQAAAYNLPTLSLGGSATRYEEPMIVYPIHAFEPRLTPPFDATLFQVAATASYTLFDGGARSAHIREARHAWGAAAASLGDSERELLMTVVSTYLDALVAGEILAAHDARIESFSSELARVRELESVGRAPRVAILRVEAVLADARADRVRAELALDLAERDLARLMGVEPTAIRTSQLVRLALVDERPPSRELEVEKALQANAFVRIAQEQLGAADARLTAARSRRLPSLGVVGRYVDYGAASGANALEWNVGLEVSYPLFTGGSVASAITEADALRRSRQERLRLSEAEVSQEIDRALSTLGEASARLSSLQTAVARYEEVARIENLRLETGVGIQTDYLDAQADLLQAKASATEARYATIRARVRLARITAELGIPWLEGSLRSAP